MKRTASGFAIYTEFTDTDGNRVRVQHSGVAFSRRVWIFCQNAAGKTVTRGKITSRWVALAPHLSTTQARRVAKALLAFADAKD